MKYIYFDSCCFISYLSGDQNGEKLKGVIKAAAEQKVRIITSAFTEVEVVKLKDPVTKCRQRVTKEVMGKIQDCFDLPNNVFLINVDGFVARKARDLVWDCNVDPKDAMHLGTAVYFKETYLEEKDSLCFWTFDTEFIKRVQRSSVDIDISEPKTSEYPYQSNINEALNTSDISNR
jgi:hypothetical protein